MKLVLIDRDGVINKELDGYVTNSSVLAIYPNAFKAFRLFKDAGFTCVVITNQSLVGRGMITEEQLILIHNYMCEEVQKRGGNIAEVIYCTDHPNNVSSRRKPAPGMLLEALEKYQPTAIDTPFIGDAITDIQAAHAAGCKPYLVQTGKGSALIGKIPDTYGDVVVCEDILDAAQKIVERNLDK